MRTHYILDGEISESHFFVANFLQLLRVCLRCQFAICFGLGSCAHHLSRGEYQSRRLWVSNTHNGCCKPLRFIFYIATFQTDIVKVKLSVEKGGRHNILQFRQVFSLIYLSRNSSVDANPRLLITMHLVIMHTMLRIWLNSILLWDQRLRSCLSCFISRAQRCRVCFLIPHLLMTMRIVLSWIATWRVLLLSSCDS